jgi:peptide-methionine (S)-S-oxide reductase
VRRRNLANDVGAFAFFCVLVTNIFVSVASLIVAAPACTCRSRAVYRNRRKFTKRGKMENNGTSRTEVATLGGGCFWCLEAVYQELRGVEKVESGYSGGDVPNPTYRQVCSETTGHAEVVQVTFDPDKVSYRDILEVYFTIHDPTTLNRQGADVGTQYRSVVFYHDEEQKRVAEEVISDLETEGIWNNPIVTEVAPLDEFYVAEDYHQDYFRNNGFQPYCQVIIAPKVAKFRKQHLERLKA